MPPRRRRRAWTGPPRIVHQESDSSQSGEEYDDSGGGIPIPPFAVVASDSGESEDATLEEDSDEDDSEDSSSSEEEQSIEKHAVGVGAETSNLVNTPDEDKSGLPQCPVCYEPWAPEGPHRVCCIPCGHVYGRCCLEKWLQRCKSRTVKCPQCNKRFSRKDIINLYAPKVVVPNRDLEEQLRSLREKYESAEMERKHLLEELRNHKKLQLKCKSCGMEDVMTVERSEVSKSSFCNAGTSRFILQNELLLHGARVMAIDAARSIILASSKAPGTSTEHILSKFSMQAPQQADKINVPPNTKAIRDICFLQEGLAVIASLGKKLSFLSMRSNNTVLQYNLPAPAWSCSGDAASEYHVYAGLQNGMLLIFDMRQTSLPLHSMEGLSTNPVHTVHSFPGGGKHRRVLTASAIGPCLWDAEDPRNRPSLMVENRGVCISVACAPPPRDYVVASFRPKVDVTDSMVLTQSSVSPSGNSFKVGYHALIRKASNASFEIESSDYSNVSELRMSKSAIVPCGPSTSFFAYGDEQQCAVRTWELRSFQKHCDLGRHHHPILDVRYALGPSGEGYLGCLSEEKLQLYRVT